MSSQPPPPDDDRVSEFFAGIADGFVDAADVTVDGIAYRLMWSPQMCADLTAAVGDADVAWLTSWRQLAGERLAPLVGLPDWPHVPHPRDGHKVRGVVQDQFDRPRPFVWIDDLLPAHDGGHVEYGVAPARVHQALRDAGTAMPPHLLISPTPHTGLQPSEIRRIADFIDEVIS